MHNTSIFDIYLRTHTYIYLHLHISIYVCIPLLSWLYLCRLYPSRYFPSLSSYPFWQPLRRPFADVSPTHRPVWRLNPCSVGKRVSSVGKRVSSVGKRVSSVGKRVSSVGKRVSSVGKRISSVGKRISSVGAEIAVW